MLKISTTAAQVIDALLASASMPAGSAMRIARTEDAGSGALPIGSVDVRGPELELALVTHPETGDQPLANTRGFLASEIVSFLDHQTLDAQDIDGAVSFTLSDQ